VYKTFLEIAVRNLVQARRRTLVLAVALSLVTMLLVLLLALSAGLSDTMIRSATTLSTGHVNIGGFFKAKISDVSPLVTDKTRLKALVREHVDGLDYVVDRGRGFARIISPTTSIQVGLTGIDVTQEKAFLENIRLAPRSEYVDGGTDEIRGDVSQLAEPGAAMLFAAQARRLSVEVGDQLSVVAETVQGARNSTELTVVAVAKDIGFLSNFSIFVHEDALRQVYHVGPDVTGAIHIYLNDHNRSAEVMKKLRPVLEEAGYDLLAHEPVPFFTKFGTIAGQEWTGQKLDVTTWEDEVLFLTWVLNAVDTVSFALVSILVVLIGIGVMNSMWVSVRERTPEVGTLRAIGMGRRQVLFMFLLEALALGLLSTTLGSVLGAAVAGGLDALDWSIPSEAVQAILMSETLNLVVKPQQLVLAVAAFTGLSGLAAVLPAYRASRLQPVTAIHFLG
jgi:putative ABC transport system permease protein